MQYVGAEVLLRPLSSPAVLVPPAEWKRLCGAVAHASFPDGHSASTVRRPGSGGVPGATGE